MAAGILTEVYYPTVDTPQIRDLQFLITDGQTFFHDERRDTRSTVDCVSEAALGFEIENVASNGLYTITKTLIGHPHQDCVLMHTRLEAAPDVLPGLELYLLCAPHLEIGGWNNNAETLDTAGGRILVAFKGTTWLAIGASVPLLRTSCGYVAVNDGWTDLRGTAVSTGSTRRPTTATWRSPARSICRGKPTSPSRSHSATRGTVRSRRCSSRSPPRSS